MTLARAEFHKGAFSEAEQRLRGILDAPDTEPTLRARALGTLADIADRRGDFRQAFQHYVASKHELKAAYERSEGARPGSFMDLTQRLAAAAERLPTLSPAASASAEKPCPNHVFLLGFPRTGTTLLEQCLAGHPNVVTSDEIAALNSALAPCLAAPDPFAAFAAAGSADIAAMRVAYWRRIGQKIPSVAGRTCIDKMPLNSVLAGFIPALFPDAKIIFAVRDPRDVVFSCFRRRFGMNSATYEFCTLEGSVALFCATMRLFELTRAKTALPVTDCRYEDVVRDLRGSVVRVCDFIGLDWREDMERFSERAKLRPLSTVSAPQLAQGLYDGAGSWRAYTEFMAPFLPQLAPWIARFGYAPE
jgi:hypothetical protein